MSCEWWRRRRRRGLLAEVTERGGGPGGARGTRPRGPYGAALLGLTWVRSATGGTTLEDRTHDADVRGPHRAVHRSCHVGLPPIQIPYRIDRNLICGKVRRRTRRVNGVPERSRIPDGPASPCGGHARSRARQTHPRGAGPPEVRSPQADCVQPDRTVRLSWRRASVPERDPALPAPTTGGSCRARAIHAVRRRRTRPRRRPGTRRPGAARRAGRCRRPAGPAA